MKENKPISSQQPNYAEGSALGQGSQYNQAYSAELLFPIARDHYRITIDKLIDAAFGYDLWQCYELSWLNNKGLPQVACGNIKVPLSTPNIVESKSLKLYLNSLHNKRFNSELAVKELIEADLALCLGGQVQVTLFSVAQPPSDWITAAQLIDNNGLLDVLDIECDRYQRDPQLLVTQSNSVSDERVYSHLLRSHCPVTNQPDWGSLSIQYSGREINRASLLRYIVSFREHNGFHEQCVEQIYSDIMHCCKPDELTVYAQYTRRGGLDINPLRSTISQAEMPGRIWRQ